MKIAKKSSLGAIYGHSVALLKRIPDRGRGCGCGFGCGSGCGLGQGWRGQRPPRVWNSVLCGSNHHPARQIDAARVRARVLSDVSGTASYRGRGDGFRGSEQRPLVLSHEKTKETTHFAS